MKTEISAAPAACAVVQNLFALYAHDMSEFVGIDVEDDGRFAIPASLSSYWEGPDASQRHPFLVRADGKLAGFALIRQIGADPVTLDMGEFFILRKYRRSGLGRQVACALFDRFAGDWEVRELPSNTTAQAFWRRVIADYTREAFTEGQEFFAAHGREFVVQRFRGGQSRSACHLLGNPASPRQ
jgi:predicted acetyltransferase